MTFDFAAARRMMVDTQVRVNDVTDVTIQTAMKQIPRERLCPAGQSHMAYADAEVEYAPGRWLLRPRDAAKLLQSVRPRAGETALCIAAPYLADILDDMGLIVTRLNDGDLKAAPAGPFDVVVCEGAVADVPASWTAALADGGRLGVIVRKSRAGKARIYVKTGADLGWREPFDANPPVLAGFEPVVGFAF